MKNNNIILLILLVLLYGCSGVSNDQSHKQSRFNFSDTIKIAEKVTETDSSINELRIAIAAISSPRETFIYYNEMFKYIENETGMKVKMVQRKTYEEINQLAKSNQIDIAFVCSGGYVYGTMDSSFQLLAIPQRDGKRQYQAYIITHKNTGVTDLEDLRGKKFAFTDPLSTAGKLYPHKKLKEKGVLPCDFFSHTIYTYAHDNSIQLVAKQMVDGAAVNSLVFDYLAIFSPDRVKNIRIIDKSEWFAMPPIVVSSNVPVELKEKLKVLFLNIHKDEASKKVLEKLLVDKYVSASDTCFRSVRDMVDYIEE